MELTALQVHRRVSLLTKTLRIMRMSTFMMLAFSLTLSARTISQTITFTGNKVPLEKLLSIVKEQTGYLIVYDKQHIRQAAPVSISATHLPFMDFIALVLKDQPYTFSIIETTIFIKKTPVSFNGNTLPQSLAMMLPVTGTIHDAGGKPLDGVNVLLKGSKTGTVTDAAGYFIINAEVGGLLAISAIGYETTEIKITDNKPLKITLTQKISTLDESIVIAYGTTTRRLNTGNVSKVSSEEIGRQPVGNSLAALEGRVPGMVVTQSTGLPGGSFSVQVRGLNAIDRTITDDQPLFVVDGVPFAPNNAKMNRLGSALGEPSSSYALSERGGVSPFNSINPSDIESIEVLKDADATSIYGSRGANGVVLITTKKAKAGKTTLGANIYTGWSKLARPVKMMNTQQYVAMRNAAFKNDGVAPTLATAYDLMAWDTTRYTDYNSLLSDNTASVTDAQLSIGGGNASTQFSVRGSFRNESTILPGDFADKRGVLHFNITHKALGEKMKFVLTGSYSSEDNRLTRSDPYSSIFFNYPNLKLYEPNGALAWNEGGNFGAGNPLAFLNNRYQYRNNAIQGNLQWSYAVTKNIRITANTGYNYNQLKEKTINPAAAQNPAGTISRSSNFNENGFTGWIIEPQVEYTAKAGPGRLTVLGGATWQAIDNDGSGITATGYSSDNLMNAVSPATGVTATNWSSGYRYNALFGRVNYNLDNKYILNLSARRDGSSRFGNGRQYASFGSAGAAWIFSDEPWFRDKLSFISYGKLRGSYGITGNDKITDYQYLDTWLSSANTYNGSAGLYPNKLYNPNYQWEKTNKLEFALETGFLNDNIIVSAAYYRNRSSNQLVRYQLPGITGFTSIVANLPAMVENNGWEITLSTTNLKTAAFKWSTSFNITLPKNKLVSFPGLAGSSYATTYVEGASLNLIYAYKFKGVNPTTGLYTVEDVDKNGVYNIADRQVLGNLDPVMYGGLSNSLEYKKFTLDIFFSFRKQTGVNYLGSANFMPGAIRTLPADMTGFWEKPGDQATLQRLSRGDLNSRLAWNSFNSSDARYSDASYIRLKNLSLSYTLPRSWMSGIKIDHLRVYVQAQNLFTITGYKIGDPETQFLTRTPPLRTLATGLQLTF